ncbi:MAG: hypothetical protein UY18_C0034G0003 [Microgenomates group bacterium GW2011_GWF2_47_9]|nr:MAG: hypothetical protein UY18_C0034G0003 [Microgenomates group bacterium GW2011_GWF2_47_9]
MYYAFLGHQPDLSRLELETLVGETTRITPEVVSIGEEGHNLMERADDLGGTTKIARFRLKVGEDKLLENLQTLIEESSAKNVAVSNYSSFKLDPSSLYKMKEGVLTVRKVRFVSFDDFGHELLMLKKKHVAEFNIIPLEDEYILAETVWIYDGLSFAARDRKKPYQDIKRGMLPPKIARIMVNLGTMGEKGKTIYDPFCGTGTVLAEAMMVACRTLGSDLDSFAVKGTLDNLEWLKTRYNLGTEYYASVADATHPVLTELVDAIVTEPLMGPLIDSRKVVSPQKVANIAKGLDKLYRGSLKAWTKILKKGGRVVMIIPEFRLKDRTIKTTLVDTMRSLGYNHILSVPYHKPNALVVRNITILERA